MRQYRAKANIKLSITSEPYGNNKATTPKPDIVLSGEDADLIMLSLALHEENFCVLRKRMKWDAPDLDQDVAAEVGGSGNPTTNWALGQDEQGIPDAAPYGFHLVQIDVLRGYLKASLA